MLHRNLKIPELWDLKDKSGERSGGIFGMLRSLNAAVKTGEYYPIICWDAGLAPRRLEAYPDYKGHLSKAKSYRISEVAEHMVNNPDSQLPSDIKHDDMAELKEKVRQLMENKRNFGTTQDKDDYMYQYRAQRSEIINICNSLGIPSIRISEWEGDDLMAILSRMANRSVIVTDDKDMIQLLSPTTDVHRVVNKQYLTYDQYMKDNGLVSLREMIITKAIEGDGSDNIPSVTSGEEERKYRVGGTTAAKIAKVIVLNDEDPEKYLPLLEDNGLDGKDKNKCLGFVRNHDIYLRNMELVDLSLVNNESAIVDTIIAEVKSRVGTSNLIDTLGKLGAHNITNFDVNSMISKVLLASKSVIVERS